MKYKCIAFDVDGTLIDDEHNVLESTRKAVTKAFENQIEVIIATGRSANGLDEYLKYVPEIRYVVGENGAMLYDYKEKKLLAHDTFNKKELDKILEVYHSKDIMMEIFYNGMACCKLKDALRLDVFGLKINEELFLHNEEHIESATLLFKEHGNEVEKLCLFHLTEEERDASYEILKDLDATVLKMGINNIEIAPKNVNKASGLRRFAEYFNYDLSEIVACGDDHNDIEMLEEVGLGVVMENGSEDAKAVADYMTGNNNEDGILQCVEYVLSLNK